MESKELAARLMAEVEQLPGVSQTLVKTVVDTVKTEIKEGRVLLGELLESEDKFFQTLADIVDASTNTGLLDPWDNGLIRKFIERTLRPLLVKCLGGDFMDDLRKMLG